ncbi:MAG: 6-phosphogluconolactonase, partial [Cyclobacteriaceae bacterium]|nr:6-phosphogluconolactonase [Cyclobacteriaceae bacterium]
VHVYWGDERCVPPDHEDSNYGMTKKHLLGFIDIPENNIHRIKGELNPEEASAQYDHELKANHSEGNIPVFDLVILGMGDDGHTASIFPHEINLWDSDEFCVVATHPTSGQQRVSLTGKVINSARSAAFLVTGKSKAKKIHEILETNDDQSPYPASLVNSVEGILYWFLDSLAASQLKDVE